MPNWLDILGQQMAGQAAGGIMGMMFGGINDQRQLRQQEDLQRLQIQGQKEMTDYGFKKQLQMWIDTNYSAQVEQLKKAGLNPALLYGMGGAGGATTGGGAGTVQGAHAPTGGGELQAMAGMGIGTPLIAAQIEKTKAETANINADTANKPIQGKNIETQTLSLAQGIENQKASKELIEVETDIKRIHDFIQGKTQNMAIAIISNQLQESEERLQIIKNQHKLSDQTLHDQRLKIRAEMLGEYIQNEVMKAQKTNIESQTKTQDWTRRYTIMGGYYNQLRAIGIAGANSDNEIQKLQNDIINETGLAPDIIEKGIQAIIVKDLIKTTPTRNPVGYK